VRCLKPTGHCGKILAHLERGGSLTPYSAYNLFKTLRLAARIHELRRRGIRIKDDRVWLPHKRVHVANYYL
jgi:hypothetical protein